MLDLQIRSSGIGGSEIAAIMGVDPWSDPFAVYAAKHGLIKPEPPTDHMKLGKLFEEIIACRWYAGETGFRVEWCNRTFVAQGREWQIYTPDALVTDERIGVDSKLVFWDRAGEWTEETVPPRVWLQAHWYLCAMDYERWDIAAVINGKGRIYRIYRDLELEDELLRRAEEFWRRYIVGSEIPPIGPSAASGAYLKQRYPQHNRVIREATPLESDLLNEYAELRSDAKDIKQEKQIYENRLKDLIGDDAGIENGRARLTWTRTKDVSGVDWEALANRLMNDGQISDEMRGQLLEQHTAMRRAGSRRLYFSGPSGEDEE